MVEDDEVAWDRHMRDKFPIAYGRSKREAAAQGRIAEADVVASGIVHRPANRKIRGGMVERTFLVAGRRVVVNWPDRSVSVRIVQYSDDIGPYVTELLRGKHVQVPLQGMLVHVVAEDPAPAVVVPVPLVARRNSTRKRGRA